MSGRNEIKDQLRDFGAMDSFERRFLSLDFTDTKQPEHRLLYNIVTQQDI